MKIRQGFISNSSSSSFVIPIRKIEIINRGGDLVIPADKLQKLLKYGFKPTVYSTPSMLENSSMCMKSIEVLPLENAEALAYQVTCNELDVIAELLRLDVSFQASCHYGHESVFHKTGSKDVWFIANPGVEYEMYGLETLQEDIKEFENDPQWDPSKRSSFRCESVASILAEEELIDKRCNSIQDENND